MSTTPNGAPLPPLVAFGFTPQEAAALHVLWSSRYFIYFLEAVPELIQNMGGTPEEALDWMTHSIEPADTDLYYRLGFTPHQAAILEADPTAKNNVHGDADDNAHRANVLLNAHVPSPFLYSVLRVATTPSEVDRFIHRYEQAAAGTPVITDHGPDTLQSLTGEVGMLTALLTDPVLACRCP